MTKKYKLLKLEINLIMENIMSVVKDKSEKIKELQKQLMELQHEDAINKIKSLNKEVATKKVEVTTASPEAIAIKTSLNTMMTNGVLHNVAAIEFAKIFSCLLDEKIDVGKTNNICNLKDGQVIVLLANPNGHGYPINTPIITADVTHIGRTTCMLSDGKTGNNAPIESNHEGTSFRLATKEEVASFLKVFMVQGIEAFVKINRYTKF